LTGREKLLLDNVLDALDRLFDGQIAVIDFQALLFATSEAMRHNVHFDHFEDPLVKLLSVVRSQDSKDAQRDRALEDTDELRHYLAECLA
jgi:hypothetical protein